MALRGLVKLAIFIATLYSLLYTLPASVAEYCSLAPNAESVQCTTYFTLQTHAAAVKDHVGRRAQPYVDRASAHPWTVAAAARYSDSPIPALVSKAHDWIEREGKPRYAAVAKRTSTIVARSANLAYERGHACALRGYAVGSDLSRRGCAQGRVWLANARIWAEQQALPFARAKLAVLRAHAARLVRRAWAQIESSNVYKEWVVQPYRRIVRGPSGSFATLSPASDASASSVAGTVILGAPDSTPSAEEHSTQETAAPTPAGEGDAEPEASPEEILPTEVVPEDTKIAGEESAPTPTVVEDATRPEAPVPESPTPDLATTEATTKVTTEDKFETVKSKVEEASTAAHTAQVAQPTLKSKWLKRLARTVAGAVSNLDEVGMAFIERSTKQAQPEIMGELREISKYGDEAVLECVKLADELESRSPASLAIEGDAVYPMFEDKSWVLASKAISVRQRAEKLAQDVIDGLVPIRQTTLDGLDDYFDIVLVEAAREVSDDELSENPWSDYVALKLQVREDRKRIEDHEFDMEAVNTALRESQLAAVVLVQDFNRQLTELRARCQIVLQERAAGGAPSQKQEGSAESAKSDEPERGAAKPAAYVIDEIVEFQDEPEIELPFDDEVEAEDPEFIETRWETLKVYQTVTI